MFHESCPLRDELRLFLDDQVDPVRHATLESHFYECRPCQEWYRDQAVALVRKAIDRQQSSQREAFLRDLRDVVQTDPAMKPLRRRLRAVLGG